MTSLNAKEKERDTDKWSVFKSVYFLISWNDNLKDTSNSQKIFWSAGSHELEKKSLDFVVCINTLN